MDDELPEPVRGRALTLAADLLGRLDADAVPASLRAIARFTPSKRRRLGTAAVGVALERDDDFRAALAELLRKDDPALLEKLEQGDMPDGDPLAAAAIAWLVRPEGWCEVVATAVERSATAPAADAGELAELRAEVGRLRTAARSEPARVRAAVAQALAGAQDETAAVRRELRERTRELRAAEQRAADLAAERDELARRLETIRSGQEAEIRRLRTRVQDLERAAETGRREARQGRDLDDARLALLMDTLVQAASGLRRELSLAPPAVLPADTVTPSTGAPDGGRRTIDDATALERMLAMPNVHVIVDGYNVTIGGWGGSALVDQRARLVGGMAAVVARTGVEATIAFDGGSRPAAQPPTPRGVRVLFSEGEIADDLIRRLVAAEPQGRPLCVVTSDQAIVRDVARRGAWTAPSQVLRDLLG